jgi:hypothetical protein
LALARPAHRITWLAMFLICEMWRFIAFQRPIWRASSSGSRRPK